MSKEIKETSDGNPAPIERIDSIQETPGNDRVPKRPWWQAITEPGSVWQIIIAAVLAIAIGMAVTTTVDEVPDAAVAIVGIPGMLWLRCLKAVVLPLIVVSMILAVQRLREMSRGGAVLARWTIGYYLATTLIAIVHSTIMVSLLWRGQFTEVGAESLVVDDPDEQETIDDRSQYAVHDIVVQLFQTLLPENVVNAFATDSLLAVLVSSIIVGYLIQGPDSSILRGVREVEKIITVIITFLIQIAPIGVFFLILPNLFKLNIAEIGLNLGILIGAALTGMAIQLVIIYPIIYASIVKKNPFAYWLRNSPSWITAWGSASSAGTMPVTLKCVRARGLPNSVINFTIPLGTLVNMDGTAIYFPVTVVFLAETQGISLSPTDYVIVVLLATLASIGTTPIPSSSLVLVVMIANSVDVPVTGMYGVIVAIDWFVDRFRTMTNVTGDLYGAHIITKITGIKDPVDMPFEDEMVMETTSNQSRV